MRACILLSTLVPLSMMAKPFNPHALGGFSISVDLYKYIQKILPEGKTILELGSGSGTGELAKNYTIFSIEHDKNWLFKYDSVYVYAPIKQYQGYKWYDADVVAKNMPANYDLILIDGPPGPIGRYGFLKYINLFNVNVPIIFDDAQRGDELKLLKDTAKKLNRPYEMHTCSDGKKFGVIKP